MNTKCIHGGICLCYVLQLHQLIRTMCTITIEQSHTLHTRVSYHSATTTAALIVPPSVGAAFEHTYMLPDCCNTTLSQYICDSSSEKSPVRTMRPEKQQLSASYSLNCHFKLFTFSRLEKRSQLSRFPTLAVRKVTHILPPRKRDAAVINNSSNLGRVCEAA